MIDSMEDTPPEGAIPDGFGGYILPADIVNAFGESFSVFEHLTGGSGAPSFATLKERYELLQRDVLAREAKRQHMQIRAKEEELDTYFREGSATSQLLSDDAGIALGRIREIARTTQSVVLDTAVKELQRSIEEQLTAYYLQQHPVVVEPIRPHAHSALMVSAGAASPAPVVARDPTPSLQPTASLKAQPSVQVATTRRGKHPRSLALDEALSATTALHAESLAVLLRCEYVRIYTLDSNRALELAAQFPFIEASTSDSPEGDFMTKAVNKALLSAVVEKSLAVSGFESRPNTMQSSNPNELSGSSQRDGEDDISLVRTCLAWPIVAPSGSNRVLGLIYAINKEGATAEHTKRFTPDDETTVHVVSKTLGCIFERYPSDLFTRPVGAQIHQMCHPQSAMQPHLPEKIVSEVEGAQRVANDALRTEASRVIYRGPVNAIFKASMRERRPDEFKASTFGTLSGVEYNMEALKDLWRVSYDENVSMHMQCRILSSKVRDLKVIVKSMVDGLSTARAIIQPADLRMYLRELELSLRAENAEQITLRIEAAMEAVIKGALPKEQPAIVTSDVVATRLKQRRKENDAAISSIHVDGPDSVRSYTCDPVTKLLQVRAISELMEKHRHVDETKSSHPDKAVPPFARDTFASTGHIRGKKVYDESEDRNVVVMRYTHTKVDPPTAFRLKPAKPAMAGLGKGPHRTPSAQPPGDTA